MTAVDLIRTLGFCPREISPTTRSGLIITVRSNCVGGVIRGVGQYSGSLVEEPNIGDDLHSVRKHIIAEARMFA